MKRTFLPLLSLAVVAGFAILVSAPQATAGKPGSGGGGGSTLPKVRFQIQYFGMPHGAGSGNVDDMNSLGETVGWYLDSTGQQRAFAYLPDFDPQTACDLNDYVTAPEGWIIASAVGINDQGVIVGYLSQTGSTADPNARRGYVLDTGAATLTLQSLPDSAWTYSYPRRINENGDILGLYMGSQGAYYAYLYNPAVDSVPISMGPAVSPASICLNNPQGARAAQVGGLLADGTEFWWSPEDGMRTVTSGQLRAVNGMNDNGTQCGYVFVKNKIATAEYTNSLVTLPNGSAVPYAINNGADLITSQAYYQDGWGFLSMSSLIDTSDPDYAIWKTGTGYGLLGLGERDSTNFGKVCGGMSFANGSHGYFVLTPVSIP